MVSAFQYWQFHPSISLTVIHHNAPVNSHLPSASDTLLGFGNYVESSFSFRITTTCIQTSRLGCSSHDLCLRGPESVPCHSGCVVSVFNRKFHLQEPSIDGKLIFKLNLKKYYFYGRIQIGLSWLRIGVIGVLL